MSAYYNENDPFAAQWLRNLIADGRIAPGEVDERDIRDVLPADLAGFDQCHFFAGIAVWSHALRLAGWPDDRPVWTGSCPCQPFSAAGRGGGVADERHLWPAWFHLIGQRRPPVVYGEQVASKAGLGWFDLVSADLEGSGYAVGANDICAAGVGAPHIRQRLWFVAEGVGDMRSARPPERECNGRVQREALGPQPGEAAVSRGDLGGLAHPNGRQRDGLSGGEGRQRDGQEAGREQGDRGTQPGGAVGRVADADGRDTRAEREQPGGQQRQQPQDGGACGLADAERDGGGSRRSGSTGTAPGGMQGADRERQRLRPDAGPSCAPDDGARRPGPTNGFWRDADWLFCHDGKWRPVRPGSFPLAHGVAARVGKLRAYGNAINPWNAAGFIAAHMDPPAP